jgi:hypothetical protein
MPRLGGSRRRHRRASDAHGQPFWRRQDPEAAQKALAEATELAIKQGGTVHEDAPMDAAEMALDGCTIESTAERIKQERGRVGADRRPELNT